MIWGKFEVVKIAVFSDEKPCNLVRIYWSFEESTSSISFPLKVSLIYDSEASVNFYQTTRNLIQEDIDVRRA